MDLLSIHNELIGYIGPGLSGGIIGVILGFLASIGLAILAIVWYPLKRLIKGKKKHSNAGAAARESVPQTAASAEVDPGKGT